MQIYTYRAGAEPPVLRADCRSAPDPGDGAGGAASSGPVGRTPSLITSAAVRPVSTGAAPGVGRRPRVRLRFAVCDALEQNLGRELKMLLHQRHGPVASRASAASVISLCSLSTLRFVRETDTERRRYRC